MVEILGVHAVLGAHYAGKQQQAREKALSHISSSTSESVYLKLILFVILVKL
jgi:hypothetical protein